MCSQIIPEVACQKTHVYTHWRKNFFIVKSLEVNSSEISVSKHTCQHTPLNCETFGAQFSQTSTLKTHMSTHTGEKPLHCEICGAKFSTKLWFQNTHVDTHWGETFPL